MNNALLLQVADAIENETIKGLDFNMGHFRGISRNEEGEICKTVACIAGHAVYIKDEELFQDHYILISDIAQKFLGLNDRQANRLFYHSGGTRKQAATTIRYLVDTGIVDWNSSTRDIRAPWISILRMFKRMKDGIIYACKVSYDRTKAAASPNQAGNTRLGRKAESAG